jgi:hypothetical protein
MEDNERTRLEKLLSSPVDETRRSTFSYYRKVYQNPAVGDVIKLMHYSDDYNWVALVVDVINDGIYMLVPLQGNIGNRESLMDLTIPADAKPYKWNFKNYIIKRQTSGFVSMVILNIPRKTESVPVDDRISTILKIIQKTVLLSPKDEERIAGDLVASGLFATEDGSPKNT